MLLLKPGCKKCGFGFKFMIEYILIMSFTHFKQNEITITEKKKNIVMLVLVYLYKKG